MKTNCKVMNSQSEISTLEAGLFTDSLEAKLELDQYNAFVDANTEAFYEYKAEVLGPPDGVVLH